MNRKFLVVRVLHGDGIVFPSSQAYGDVEIYSHSVDFTLEKEAINQSLQSFNIEENLTIAQRIKTIVECNEEVDADIKAEAKFQQVLDNLERRLYGSGSGILLDPGYIKDLESGIIQPRLPKKKLSMGPMFKVHRHFIEPIDTEQALFLWDNSELRSAVIRCNHWYRNAKIETNKQLRCLFLWFSIETIAKEGNENIIPRLLVSLGFPVGKIGEFLSNEIIQNIKIHPQYNFAYRYLSKQFENIRTLRNNIVHSGFRTWDVPLEDLEEYEKILTLTSSGIYQLAIKGLFEGLVTIKELWEYTPIFFSYQEDLTTNLHGNILYKFSQNK
ncbi:HEPN domain-containing protein [Paenibacillus sp. FSL H7-689]|uniref:HEPN domain-containing protein n=1 Tax=Paenibacillus sp. FSL H7-689 TaxID=1227349 RepID=UPI0003E214DA|nr:HEPN domain-containing protein [Paenibacillus sp. FSL H7-689]ETT47818.1 hypothetical protein C170_21295 [Paenibacillus sp. FSL H7-689]